MTNPLRLGIFSNLQAVSDRQQKRKDHDMVVQQSLEDRALAQQDRQRKMTLEDAMAQRQGEQYEYAKSQRPLEEQLKEAQIGGMQAQAAQRRALATKGPPKPRPNEFNNKAAFMLEGAKHASGVLDHYSAPAASMVRKVPFLGNYGLSENDQVAQQAAETMYDSYLRLTTGATIAPEELKNAAKQFVPQPGDSPGVLRAKALRRRQILDSMQRAAQPALDAAGESPSGNDEQLPFTEY